MLARGNQHVAEELAKTYIARELFRVLSTGQLYSLPAEMDPIS
jgi:hypothetical protein